MIFYSFRNVAISVLIFLFLFAFLFINKSFAWVSTTGGSLDSAYENSVPMFDYSIRNIIETPDNKILIGGAFTSESLVGYNRLARLNTDASIDTSFNIGTGFNSDVRQVAIDSNGKYLVIGDFTFFNGVTQNRAIRLNTDGSKDGVFNIGTGFNVAVNGVAEADDGKLYFIGNFTSFNGNVRNRIVRLFPDGTLDNSFNIGSGFNGSVNEVKIQSDGKIILVGNFTTYNGATFNRIIRLNTDATVDNSFNIGTGLNNTPVTIAIQSDGKILVGGAFNSYNGVTRNSIVRINTNGSIDTSFDLTTAILGNVDDIEVLSDGRISMVGGFTYYKTTPTLVLMSRSARFLSDGTPDTYYSFPDGYTTDHLITAEGDIYLVGQFYLYNSSPRHFIVKTNLYGTQDESFQVNPSEGLNGPVNTVASINNEDIYLGGYFTYFNGFSQNYFLKVNNLGQKDNSFNIGSGFDTYVTTIAVNADGKVYVGGFFNIYNGTNAKRIVRLNTDGSIDNSFVIGTGFNNRVDKIIILNNGKVLVAGNFTNYNGTNVNRIVLLNTDGSIDNTFEIGTGFNQNVIDLTLNADGKIIVVGNFTSYKDILVNRIVRLNNDGSIDNTFNVGSGLNSTVMQVEVDYENKVLVAGSFTSYNGTTRNRIVRINNDGSIDNSFNIGTGFNSTINSLAVQPDGKVIVGGLFVTYNGLTANRLIRLNKYGTIDADFNSGIGLGSVTNNNADRVDAIGFLPNGKILIAGRFNLYNNNRISFFMILENNVQYQIYSSNSNIDYINTFGESVKIGSSTGSVSNNQQIYLIHNGIYISDLTVDFSLAMSHDWRNVIFESDLLNSSVYIYNLNPIDASGASATHSLFIPKKDGQDGVFICPNASNLSDVFIGCVGGYSINEGNPALSIVSINSVEYWRVSGLTSTGGLGKYLSGQSFEILPNSAEMNEILEVNLIYQSLGGFNNGDRVQFTFEESAGFILQNTCTNPTIDANGDNITDGSATIISGNTYEYLFNNSIIGPVDLSFCVNITTPNNLGSYNVVLNDDNSSFGSTLFYIGGDNEFNMSAHVPPTISLNIRSVDDLSETSSCTFGTINSTTLIPNYDNIVDTNRGECGYGLAVSTNSPNGFVVQVSANAGLMSGTNEIVSINNGDLFLSGKEGYGFASITASTKGRNVVTGEFNQTITREGVFGLGTASIPQTSTSIFSHSSTVDYLAGGDNMDLNIIIHGLVIGSGTPAGSYSQDITYTVTPIF